VSLWNIAVFFVSVMRRVDCPSCGVTVEQVPWGEGKEHLTTRYRWFLARWAKRLSWQETADAFSTTWDNVFRSVKHVVEWGLATWFRARGTISSGVVEGFRGTAKLTTSTAFGFRTPQGIEIALFHVLGQLPEPGFTHRFCSGGLSL